METGGYCHPGYPLLLAPLYWVTSDVTTFYLGVFFINTALIALILPLSTHISNRHFGLSPVHSMFVGGIALTYPGALIMRHHAWPESALFPGVLIIFLLYCRWIDKPNWIRFVLIIVAAFFLYAVHPKTIIFLWVILLGLFFGYLSFSDRLQRLRSGLAILIVLSYLFLFSLISEYATSSVWLSGSTDVILSVSKSVTPHAIENLVLKNAGVMVYAAIVTGGLVFLVLSFGARSVFRSINRGTISFSSLEALEKKSLFVLVAIMLFVLETSVFFVSASRFDTYFYGRHVDPIILVSIVAALSLWITSSFSRSDGVWAVILIVFAFGILVAYLPGPPWSDYSPIHVIGARVVFDYLYDINNRADLLLAIGVLLLFSSLAAASVFNWRLRLLGILPFLISTVIFHASAEPWRGDPIAEIAMPKEVRDWMESMEGCHIVWDRSIRGRRENHQYFRMQYYFPNCSIERVTGPSCGEHRGVIVTQSTNQTCQERFERMDLPPGLVVHLSENGRDQ